MLISDDSFRSNPDPMWIYETDTGVVIDANQAALDLFGLLAGEFVGKRADALASARWQISGGELISRSASPSTGKAVRIRVTEVDLEAGESHVTICI